MCTDYLIARFLTFSSDVLFQQMGKSEQMPHRFRRKAKGSGPSSANRENTSNSLVSSLSAVDNLLCDNLVDSSIASEPASHAQTTQLPQGHAAANGCSDAELTDSEAKGSDPCLRSNNGVDAVADLAPSGDPERPKDLRLSSHLPSELAGLHHSEITPLCSDQSLDLSACHVHGEGSLAFVVFVYNSSASDVQQVLLELDSDELEVFFSF